MNKYAAAADALRNQANKFKSLVAAADALAEVGSLEQAADECRAAAAAVASELGAVQADLVKAKADVKKAKEQAADIVAKANDQALAKLGES